jgi:hypothetical protein
MRVVKTRLVVASSVPLHQLVSGKLLRLFGKVAVKGGLIFPVLLQAAALGTERVPDEALSTSNPGTPSSITIDLSRCGCNKTFGIVAGTGLNVLGCSTRGDSSTRGMVDGMGHLSAFSVDVKHGIWGARHFRSMMVTKAARELSDGCRAFCCVKSQTSQPSIKPRCK